MSDMKRVLGRVVDRDEVALEAARDILELRWDTRGSSQITSKIQVRVLEALAKVDESWREELASLERRLAELRAVIRRREKTIRETHGPAVVHSRCENVYCNICVGGLYQCSWCGAAEVEADERVCTGPKAPALKPSGDVTQFWYENHRGELSKRTVIPERLWYGVTEWYRSPQWFIRAFDVDRQDKRDFALAKVGERVPVQDLTVAHAVTEDEEERVKAIYRGVTDQNSAEKEMQVATGYDPRVAWSCPNCGHRHPPGGVCV